MTEFANAMEVFKLLDKSNCRKCSEQTCLAFASKVFLGERHLNECPALSHEIIGQYQGKQKKKQTSEEYRESFLLEVKEKIKDLDLEQTAERVGATFSNGGLTLRIFGKPFSIDQKGNMYSDIHSTPGSRPRFWGMCCAARGCP